MSKELIVHQKKELEELYSQENGLQPVIDRIKEVAKDFEYDLTTTKGRNLVKSQARAVSSSKKYLTDLGMQLTAEWREKTAKVNATKKEIIKQLDELRDEIRKPLTDLENAEKEALLKLQTKLQEIEEVPFKYSIDTELGDLQARLAELEQVEIEEGNWGDLEFKAFKAKELSVKHLRSCIESRIKRDEEQAELQKLREQNAKLEQERKEREERERLEREEKERKEREAKEAEERKKAEEERVAKAKKEAEEKAEREKQEAIEKEKREREEAEKRAKEAQERAERLEREQKEREEREAREKKEREEAEAKAKAEAEAKQKAYEEKQEQIKKEVIGKITAYFCNNGINEDTSYKVATLLSGGEVPYTSVDFKSFM